MVPVQKINWPKLKDWKRPYDIFRGEKLLSFVNTPVIYNEPLQIIDGRVKLRSIGIKGFVLLVFYYPYSKIIDWSKINGRVHLIYSGVRIVLSHVDIPTTNNGLFQNH